MGWDWLNLATSCGSFLFAIGVALFVVNVIASLRRGAPAGTNPWDAPTLEWAVPSPPPPYNFAVIPQIASRHPLWEAQLDEAPARSILDAGLLLDEGRETIATTALDGDPDLILKMPEDTYVPLFLAVALTLAFSGLLLLSWPITIVGGAGMLACLLIWLWPDARLAQIAGAVHD